MQPLFSSKSGCVKVRGSAASSFIVKRFGAHWFTVSRAVDVSPFFVFQRRVNTE